MAAELGLFALIVSLVVSLIGGVVPLIGTQWRILAWVRLARYCVVALGVTSTIAFGALVYCFLTVDLSVYNVAQNTNAALPWYYRLSGVWASHEGSMLFWVTTLVYWMLPVAFVSRRYPLFFAARTMGVLSLIAAGLYLFLLTTSNPFVRIFPPPLAGADLNPLLQDPGMIFHPPLLYMGYVGYAVPFAFAIALLLGKERPAVWASVIRPWALLPWVYLTLGIALGSYWSYYELGWGGWWAWDPVENASLMPWITGIVLIHLLLTTHRAYVLPRTTLGMAILTFILSLVGTFIVRSGLVQSIHAFASDPMRGNFILGFIGVVTLLSVVLLLTRGNNVKSEHALRWYSSAGMMAFGCLFLMVACVSILIGTLYPSIFESITGQSITVGVPYFNTVFGLLMVPVIVLIPIGVLIAQRGPRSVDTLKNAGLHVALTVVVGVALAYGFKPFSWFTLGASLLVAWVVVGLVLERFRAYRAKNPAMRGISTYGMWLAHLGVAVMLLGAVAVSNHTVERAAAMKPGQILTIGDYELRYATWQEYRAANYTGAKGLFTLLKDGHEVAQLYPEKRNYDAMTAGSLTEAAIYHTLTHDVYLSMATPTPDNEGWTVRLYLKPMVIWIWMGGLLMALGGLLSLVGAIRYLRSPRPRS